MTLRKLTTNEGEYYTNASNQKLRSEMFAYIRAKRQQGVDLKSILFCWGEVPFLPAQGLNGKALAERGTRR